MSDDEQECTGNHTSGERGAIKDIIQLRLPPKPEYMPVLRATVGVIAGAMSFTYDEIINLRVAALEAFELASKSLNNRGEAGRPKDLRVSISVGPDRLEIEFPIQPSHAIEPDTEEEKESRALLSSLMDELEFGVIVDSEPVIRMVKYNNARERQYGDKDKQ